MGRRSRERAKSRRALRRVVREVRWTSEIKETIRAMNLYIDRMIANRSDVLARANRKEVARKLTKDPSERKAYLGTWATNARRRKLIRLSGMQNHRCCYCGTKTWHPNIIDYETHRSEGKKATLEHLLPRSQGGTFGMHNLVMACSECNNARGAMTIEEFMNKIYSVVPVRKNVELKEVVASLNEKRIKNEKKYTGLLHLLMIAVAIFPEDYKRIMKSPEKRDYKAVFGGNINPIPTKKIWIRNIRIRAKENRMAA